MYRTVIHLPREPRLTDIRPLLVADYLFRQRRGRCLVSFDAAQDAESQINELLEWLKLKDRVSWAKELNAYELEEMYQHLAECENLREQVGASSEVAFLQAEEGNSPAITDLLYPPGRIRALYRECSYNGILIRDAEGQYSTQFFCACRGNINEENLIFQDISDIGQSLTIAHIRSKLGGTIPHFCHLPSLRSEAGSPLADSADNLSVWELKERGILPEPLVVYLLALSGLVNVEDLYEISWEEIAKNFRFAYQEEKPHSFSYSTLNDLNSDYLSNPSEESLEEILEHLKPLLAEAGYPEENPTELKKKCRMMLRQSDTLIELYQNMGMFYGRPQPLDSLHPEDRGIMLQRSSVDFLTALLLDFKTSSQERLTEFIPPVSKPGQIKLPVGRYLLAKIFLTGSQQGPPLHEFEGILAKKEIVLLLEKRLEQVEKQRRSIRLKVASAADGVQAHIFESAIATVETARNCQVVLIEGIIGSGKTYVMTRIVKRFSELNHLSYLVAARTGDETRLQMELFDQLLKVGKKVNAIPPKIYERMAPHLKRWDETRPLIDNILLAWGTKGKVIIAIDDFDKLQERTTSVAGRLGALLRFIESRHGGRVALLLSINDERKVEEALKELRQTGKPIHLRLSAIEERAAKRFLDRKFGDQLLSELADDAIYLAGGNATCLTAVAEYLKSNKTNTDQLQITKKPVTERLLQTLDTYFHNLWNSLNPLEQIILVSYNDRFAKITGQAPGYGLFFDHFHKINGQLEDDFFSDRSQQPASRLLGKEKIAQTSERLESLGLLRSKRRGKRIIYFVFSPLFGKWLKNNTDINRLLNKYKKFLQETVGIEKLGILMDITEGRSSALSRLFIKTSNQERQRYRCLKRFQTLSGDSSVGKRREAIRSLFRDLMGISSFRAIESGLWAFDSRTLGLKGLPEKIYIAYMRDGDALPACIQQLSDQAGKYEFKGRPCLLIYYGSHREAVEDQLVDRGNLRGFILDNKIMRQLIFADDSVRELKHRIVEFLGPGVCSPYQVGGVLMDLALFRGRETEMEELFDIEAPGHIIVGGRSIGKSSLLRMLEHSLEEEGITCFYFSGEGRDTVTKFLRQLGEVLRKRGKTGTREIVLDDLSNLLRTCCRRHGKVYFMIDEIESLLAHDYENARRLFSIFREVGQSYPDVTFVVAGWQVLAQATRDIQFPLYNFGKETWLGAIEEEATLKLIEEPIEKLGVQILSAQAKEEILNETSCHPYLVQFVCDKLLHDLAKPPFEITEVMVRNALQRMEFRDERLKMFYRFLSELDIAIISAFEKATTRLDLVRIHGKLADKGLEVKEEELRRSILGLKANSILRETRGELSIAFECFYNAFTKQSGEARALEMYRNSKVGGTNGRDN